MFPELGSKLHQTCEIKVETTFTENSFISVNQVLSAIVKGTYAKWGCMALTRHLACGFLFQLFEKVTEVCPNVHEKSRPISADLNQRDFAISKEDVQELLSCTNIIFHCAATVRFDAHLR